MPFAALDGFFDIQRADHAILRGADGEIDKRRDAEFGRQLPELVKTIAALITVEIGAVGVAAKAAALHNFDSRQERSQGARCGGLGCPPLTANQNAANLWVDGVENQGTFHPFLSHDRGEWIGESHGIWSFR